MRQITLRTMGFIDPGWFNNIRYGRHQGAVDDQGCIVLQGVQLRPAEPGFQAGDVVGVWIDHRGQFTASLESELQQDAAERSATREREALDQEASRQEQFAKAEAFNANLHVPVPWSLAIKDVLSGLQDGSWGDGCNKATVFHVMLAEDLRDGRLVRKAGDLLCTSGARSNGHDWSGQRETLRWVGRRVSCKTCLSIAKRWTRASKGSPT